MDIIEAIKKRRSVRTYDDRPLSDSDRKAVEEAISSATTPFSGEITLRLVSVGEGQEFRPSTYGVIKGARDFLLLALDDADASALKGGYVAEEVILKATELGLGTCWMTGTFQSSSFETATDFPAGQKLTAVIPIGYPEGERLLGRVMRSFVGASKRKPLGDMFFMNNFETPLPETGPFGKELAMMRLAPSAKNRQPWRALVRGNQVDFYCRDKSRSVLLDMGIGLSHFALTAEAENVVGSFAPNDFPVLDPTGADYLISFIQA